MIEASDVLSSIVLLVDEIVFIERVAPKDTDSWLIIIISVSFNILPKLVIDAIPPEMEQTGDSSSELFGMPTKRTHVLATRANILENFASCILKKF